MAEIIDFAEIQQARRRARAPEREHLERATEILRHNLAAVALALTTAPLEEHAELITRVERLAAMLRYALGMLARSHSIGGRGQ
ncbi:MAG TPA: hypothetical protein VEJ86_12405 [Candidatus Binataceae bacterium]|nr:hypothetical protein [Candidatus Binataceae bacterium]